MKKVVDSKLWPFVICALVIVMSCTKLKDTSYSDIVAKDFVPTNEDVGALLGSAYGTWRDVLFNDADLFLTNEETSDVLVEATKPYGFYDGGIHQRLHLHDWTSEDGYWSAIWPKVYSGINTCNRLLFQIESGQIGLPAGPEKDAVIGEIRVLRASFYYVLCDLYGNVPIVTKYDVPVGYLPTQNTRLEVYNFIVTEINESLPSLSDDHNVGTYGRFNNKWSSLALLAKIYLNAKVWSGIEEWDKCLSACDEIINANKGFALEPVQRDCFIEQNQNSKELIWTVPYDEVFAKSYFLLNVFSLPQQSSQTFNLRSVGWGGLISLPQFINTFDHADKRLTKGWIYGQVYSSSGEALTVQTGTLKGQPMIIVNELPGIDSTEEVHSYRAWKFEIPIGSDPVNMSNDLPLIRYADILMMKAECLLRLGRSGAGALVTQVRARSFDDASKALVTDAQLLEGSSYDYGLRDITSGPYHGVTHEGGADIQYGRFFDELGWEFCVEGHRRQDMIRFGIYNRKSRLSYKAFPDGSQDYRNLAPIPLNQLNTNSNLKQNPGYN
ncbi:MAG: RagB/SusD family nutrient uptake outer membrane protein [Ferruginibacter sp.]